MSGTMASLQGSKNTAALAIAKLSRNTAGQRKVRRDHRHEEHEPHAQQVGDDHHGALV